MKFEVINDKNKVVMHTKYTSCMPNKDALNLMAKAGYKFKLDNKAITVKKLNERLKEFVNDKNHQD